MTDESLERLWKSHSNELPPASLDGAIRAAARRARRRPAWQRYAPLAAAASVGVIAFLLVRESPGPAPQVIAPAETAVPVAASAPAAATASANLPAPAMSVDRAARKTSASPPSREVAQARESSPSAQSIQAESDQLVTDGELPPSLAALVRADAAGLMGIEESEVEIIASEAVTWPDGALGCRRPGELAIQVLTPGYRIEVRAAGQRLVYHTDNRTQLRRCERP